MARFRFAIEYQGTAYAGWQVQDGQPTVQEALEKALRTCLRTPVTVTGAGRTDAGVHARGQVAHFDIEEAIDPRRVEHSLNALTPTDTTSTSATSEIAAVIDPSRVAPKPMPVPIRTASAAPSRTATNRPS